MLVQIYLTSARDFFKGVDLVYEDQKYKYSSALLAIHSAISYSDALRCGLGITNLTADDHRTASTEVRKLLVLHGYARSQGVKHLDALLSTKTFVSYGPDAMTAAESKSIVEHARRFVNWTNQAGFELRIEGWRND